MKLCYTREQVERWRDRVHRRTPRLAVATPRQALAFINEVGFCMGENILTNPIDAEMGLIFGIGFPPFRGGPLHYIDQRGVGKVLQGLESFQKKWGDRFKPAPYLVQAAKENRKLFTW